MILSGGLPAISQGDKIMSSQGDKMTKLFITEALRHVTSLQLF